MPDMPTLRVATAARITPSELYRCCQLRQDVFIIEQNCPYPDMDGRDLEPETMHVWFEDGNDVLSYLRILTDPERPGGWRIGRVVTAERARGRRLAGRLMSRAFELIGDREISIGAQERLEGWYRSFGFARVGPTYLEDDIPHVPMRRPAPATTHQGATR